MLYNHDGLHNNITYTNAITGKYKTQAGLKYTNTQAQFHCSGTNVLLSY